MWHETDTVQNKTTCCQKRRIFYAKIESYAVMGDGCLPDPHLLFNCRFFRFGRHR